MTTDDSLPLADISIAQAELVQAASQYAASLAGLTDTKAVLRKAIVKAAEAGVPETQIATIAGVTRSTVRIWVGK